MTQDTIFSWAKILWIAFGMIIIFSLAGCGSSEKNGTDSNSEEAQAEVFAMDTYMTVSAYGKGSEKAVEESVEELKRLDLLLDSSDEDSDVYGMNQDGRGTVEGDVKDLLAQALAMNQSTDGAFDITVYPLLEQWGFISKKYRVVSDEELKNLLPLVGSDQIQFDEQTGEFRYDTPGMKVDFGGIAKGYASDRIMAKMKEAGIESALISLGGNVQALGSKLDGSPWKIAIQNPDGSGDYLGILSMENKAVITSGGYERYFEEDGEIYHHILDPQTGKPSQSDLVSVTIVCDKGVMGDGLSTALFVKGRQGAVDYWQNQEESFEMILLDDRENLYITPGLADSFESEGDFIVLGK